MSISPLLQSFCGLDALHEVAHVCAIAPCSCCLNGNTSLRNAERRHPTIQCKLEPFGFQKKGSVDQSTNTPHSWMYCGNKFKQHWGRTTQTRGPNHRRNISLGSDSLLSHLALFLTESRPRGCAAKKSLNHPLQSCRWGSGGIRKAPH